MHARLQGYAAAWHRSEDFLHRFRSRAQLLLAHHFARFIQHAVPTGSIAQVQTDGQFRLDILVARSLRGATLLHCRSPLSVCASSASITWERTASRRETGLLIPSVRESNPCRMRVVYSEARAGAQSGYDVRYRAPKC